MGMLGADTDELRRVAATFVQAADRVDGARTKTLSAINNADWEGPDRDAYVEKWSSNVNTALNGLGSDIDDLGTHELRTQADAQDEASAGGPGGGTPERGFFGGLWDEYKARRNDLDDESKHLERDVPLGTEVEDISAFEINQGEIGSCWLLAAVASQAEINPEQLANNIDYDEDTNEYIVTLYEDGVPVEVRVDNSFMYDTENGVHSYATGDDGQPNYASIYEKAIAEHLGDDYGEVAGGHPDEALELITGQDTDVLSTRGDNPVTSSDIATRIENGDSVVLGSPMFVGPNSPMVAGHAYSVVDVAEDGSVFVYNPWGENPDSDYKNTRGEPGIMKIPADEVDKYFTDVYVTT